MSKMETIYDLVNNPIENAYIIDKIIGVYSYSNNYEEFKNNIINYNRKSSKKNNTYEKELFEYIENNISDNELINDNGFINVRNGDVDNSFSLVLNTNYNATMKLTKLFMKECKNNDLDFDLYFNINGDTDNSLIISTNNDNINDYLRILNGLRDRFPKLFSDIKEPGLLMGRINDKYGICSSKAGIDNFYDRRCRELYDVIHYNYMTYITENYDMKIKHNKHVVPIVRFLTYYTNKSMFNELRISDLSDEDFYKQYGITREQIDDKEFFVSQGRIINDKLIETFEDKNITMNGDIKIDNFNIDYYFEGENEDDVYTMSLSKDELMKAFNRASYDIIYYRVDLFNKIRQNISDMCYIIGIDKDNYSFDYESVYKKENNEKIKKKEM